MEFSNKNAVDRTKFGWKLFEGQNKERDLFVLRDLPRDRNHPVSQRSQFQEEALCDVQEHPPGSSISPGSILGWDGVSTVRPHWPQSSERNLETQGFPQASTSPFPMFFIVCLSALNILSQ